MKYHDYLLSHKEGTCPFCDAVQRVFDSNETAYLTYAIAPYHPHHLLVIPRRHITSLLELTPIESGDLLRLVRNGILLLQNLGYKDYSVLVREGDVGKSIPHLHCHIIPKHHIGDLDVNADKRDVLSDDELNELISDIERVSKNIV